MNWNKDYMSILWLIGIGLTIFIGYFEQLTGNKLDPYQKLSLLLIGYTGLIITWYTRETFDLKIQGIKSLRSSVQPIVVAYKSGPYLTLKNVGRGIAKNVQWESISTTVNIISCSENFPGVLEPFQGAIRDEKNLVGGDLLAYKISFEGKGTIKITYENDRGDLYYSKIEVTNQERVRLLATGSSR